MPDKAKPDDLAQSQRFIDMAHEVEAGDDLVQFEKNFTIVTAKKLTFNEDETDPTSQT